ncbi:MAG: hypothetical protein EOP88_27910 [Verrucomicrobiaceae bacterium]|nr:MAG: hypothetical protein EOP88_27910 [Verrucomicrobiaceae bacterium]
MKPGYLILLAACAAGLSACANDELAKPEEVKKAPVTHAPKLVGRIASIPSDKRFVLIQSYGKWEQESGAILTTLGPDERTANLRVTGEKLGEFAAADLQSGNAAQGDAVYSQFVAKPELTPTAPEVVQTANQAPSENVQKNN